MARHASRRRQPAARRLLARSILLACVLIAATAALYTGSRSARSSVEAAAIARSTAAPQQALPSARGVQTTVPKDHETFLVATRLPGGRIAFSHATGPQLAASQPDSGASSDPLASGKETRNDR